MIVVARRAARHCRGLWPWQPTRASDRNPSTVFHLPLPFLSSFGCRTPDSDLDEEDGHGEPLLADVTGKRVVPPTTEDEPSTPEFIKEALEAGFTLELLSRAENTFNSGSTPSSSDLKLANSIVSKMVVRKTDGRPWQGPLTPPRVSPPRTFGDAIAAATYQRRSSSHRRPTRTS